MVLFAGTPAPFAPSLCTLHLVRPFVDFRVELLRLVSSSHVYQENKQNNIIHFVDNTLHCYSIHVLYVVIQYIYRFQFVSLYTLILRGSDFVKLVVVLSVLSCAV